MGSRTIIQRQLVEFSQIKSTWECSLVLNVLIIELHSLAPGGSLPNGTPRTAPDSQILLWWAPSSLYQASKPDLLWFQMAKVVCNWYAGMFFVFFCSGKHIKSECQTVSFSDEDSLVWHGMLCMSDCMYMYHAWKCYKSIQELLITGCPQKIR